VSPRPEPHLGLYLPYLRAFLGPDEAWAWTSAKGENSPEALG